MSGEVTSDGKPVVTENDLPKLVPKLSSSDHPSSLLYKINENDEHQLHGHEPYGDRPILCREGSLPGRLDSETSMHSNDAASDFVSSVDALFDLLTEDHDTVSVASLFSTLRRCGLRTSDPRLRGMMLELGEMENREHTVDVTLLILSKEDFRKCVMRSFTLIRKALRLELIIPRWTEFRNQLTTIYDHCKHINDGYVATYIPQLAYQSPDLWGVSICTIDGQRAEWGDSKVPFCLQAVSSVLSYATVRHELGADDGDHSTNELLHVHNYIGQEPSGRLFNEICLDHKGRPHNPMINAGAIISASLIKRDLHGNPAAKFDHTMEMARKFCGGTFIGFDNSTFISERSTSDRNHALAYFMREKECFPEGADLHETLDFYLQLCSLQSNADSLAVFAATLANGGTCPLTGEIVVSVAACRDTLALMYSCGLYAHSGQFAFRVGLPAKSGVSGIMLVVVPNVMGICLFSPRLTIEGNSLRSVKFCEKLVDTFSFHNYDIMSTSCDRDPRRQKSDSQREQIMKVMFCSQAGDLSALKRYALQGFNLNCSDYDNRTPLHMAAAEGHANIIHFLLGQCNVKIDPTDRWDRTPFDDAIEFGNEECARLLDEYKRKHLDEVGDDKAEHVIMKPERKITVMYAGHT